MSYVDMVHSHVQRLLCDLFDLPRVVQDEDGDYPFDRGTATFYVRVLEDDPVCVRVFAVAVAGVRRSAKLLEELNAVNQRLRFGRVLWTTECVIVEHVILASTMDLESLGLTCVVVGTVADDIGPMVAAVYGGSVANPSEVAAGSVPE